MLDRSLTLLSKTITTALTGFTLPDPVPLPLQAQTVAIQAKFTYGSGGTTVKTYAQTSLDGGQTWIDVASFAFATATATKISALKRQTALAAGVTPTDGALTDNTILDGLLGDRLRVKITTVGTYAGGTTLVVTAVVLV